MSEQLRPDASQPAPAVRPDGAGRGYGAGYGYGYGYAYGAARPAADVHLLDYVRVLYKRRWTALTAFLIIVLGVSVYTFTSTPVYQGRVQLLIEPENPNVVSFKEVMEQDKSTTDYYQTQYKILQSRQLARRTIDASKLWESAELGAAKSETGGYSVVGVLSGAFNGIAGLIKSQHKKEAPLATETSLQSRVIDNFLNRLIVSPIHNSRLVEVRFESQDAHLAATVTNTLADCYIKQNLEYRFMPTKEASGWLEEQLAQQRKKVETSELALQKYKEQGDAVALDDRQNIVVQRLSDLNAALTKARTERIEKESLYRQLADVQGNRAALDTFPAILTNRLIQDLKVQLNELQRRQAQLSEKFGEKHPQMMQVKGEIETTEARLRGEIEKVVQSVKTEYLAAQTQERQLVAALDAQKGEALALGRKNIDYSVLKREADSNRQIYESLLQRAKETGVSSELRTSNIRVVDSAEVPRRPVRPKKALYLLLALLGGLLFGGGLAFVFEYLDNRIKSPEEIKAHLGVPFLGLIPALNLAHLPGTSPVLNNGVPANFAEAFRMIRTNLLFSSADEGGRSVVVTSTAPGEGKTLVATNVAISLAQAGQRVLLVDSDMRRPRVHEVFATKQDPGLSNIMAGNAKASEAVRKSAVPGLWLLPAGVNPPNPAELIGSRRFRDLLASLDEHFDWVILDSPPVMAVTDAALAAHRTAGVLFVVGCEMTSRNAAQSAIEQLYAAKGKVVGAVLNRVNVERNSYYYAHYYKREYANYYHNASPSSS